MFFRAAPENMGRPLEFRPRAEALPMSATLSVTATDRDQALLAVTGRDGQRTGWVDWWMNGSVVVHGSQGCGALFVIRNW